MRVAEVTAYGQPDVLRLGDRPEPQPVEGRIRLQMQATTVNPVDCVLRSGTLADRFPDLGLPFVLGFDLAGTVLDAAEGFAVGDRVVGMFPWFALSTGEGSNADVVVADPHWLARLPDDLAFHEAATLPLNALTAAQSLKLLGAQRGDTILVTGASGGVGGFAAQLAAADGVRVLATATVGDESWVSGLGVDQVISRSSTDDLVAQVREAAPHGLDGVFDAALLGGPLLIPLRDGGTYVSASDSLVPDAQRDITVTSVFSQPDPVQLAGLVGKLSDGTLSTRLADTFALADIAAAHRRFEAGGLRGRLVITF